MLSEPVMLDAADDLQTALRHEGALRRLAAALGCTSHDADDGRRIRDRRRQEAGRERSTC